MFAYDTPGVYFVRPLTRPSVGRLRTDVAGFVGIARRGPLHHPVNVQSWPEFVAVFGGFTPQAYLAYAAEGFFANGGRTCWVVRVADPEHAGPATLGLADAAGDLRWRLVVSTPGVWGREIAVSAIATAEDRFTLVLRPPDGERESWPDLTLEDGDPRSVAAVLNDPEGGSALVRVCPPEGAADAELRVLPGRIVVARPAGGADGLATLGTQHFFGEATSAGLGALAKVDEVSLVAMPDLHPKPVVEVETVTAKPHCNVLDQAPPPPAPAEPLEFPPAFDEAAVLRLQQEVVACCERLRDRVALLDVPFPPGTVTDPDGARAWRQLLDSRYAALYYPWLRVPDPLRLEGLLRTVPASGHVAGVIARNDLRVGVHKPPANEVVLGVEDVSFEVSDVVHGELNSRGINVVRPYPGRGIRVAGARTLASDPAWRYLNVRRLLIMIAEAIEEQTQWTVFEPNSPRLRQQVDRVVRNFLDVQWRDGLLDGASAEEAYFVRCDETTNPPEETDAGRMICLIGVLPPYPAEFVVIRVGVTDGGVEILGEEIQGGRRG